MDSNKGKASAKKQDKGGGTRGYLLGFQRKHKNENVFARPNGRRENTETVISCRGPEPARKKKDVYQ